MLIVPGIKEDLEEGSGAISKLAHSREEWPGALSDRVIIL